jgi:hypothetical protein
MGWDGIGWDGTNEHEVCILDSREQPELYASGKELVTAADTAR